MHTVDNTLRVHEASEDGSVVDDTELSFVNLRRIISRTRAP